MSIPRPEFDAMPDSLLSAIAAAVTLLERCSYTASELLQLNGLNGYKQLQARLGEVERALKAHPAIRWKLIISGLSEETYFIWQGSPSLGGMDPLASPRVVL